MELQMRFTICCFYLLVQEIFYTVGQGSNEILTCASPGGRKTNVQRLSLEKPKGGVPCQETLITCFIKPVGSIKGVALRQGSQSYLFPLSTWKYNILEIKLNAKQVGLVPNVTRIYTYNLPSILLSDGGNIHISCSKMVTDMPNFPQEHPSTRLPAKYIILIVFATLFLLAVMAKCIFVLYHVVKVKIQERSKEPVLSDTMNNGRIGLTLGNGYTSLDMLHLENTDVKEGGAYIGLKKQQQNDYDNAPPLDPKMLQTEAYSYPYLDMNGSNRNTDSPRSNRVAIQEKGIFFRQASEIQYEDVDQGINYDIIDTYTPASDNNGNKYLEVH